MSRTLALAALAAVSLTACTSPSSTDDTFAAAADLTSAWPAHLAGNGCLTDAPAAESHVLVRFYDSYGTTYASVELYDATTGDLVERFGYLVTRKGASLSLSAASTSGEIEEATLLRERRADGSVATKLVAVRGGTLARWLGASSVDVGLRLGCDLAPEERILANPAKGAWKQGALREVTGPAPSKVPNGAACLVAGVVPAGEEKGRRLRLFFDAYEATAQAATRVRIEVVDEETGLLRSASRGMIRAENGGYHVYTFNTSSDDVPIGTIRPASVGGRHVMTFEPAPGSPERRSLGAQVPLDCDFF